MTKDNELSRDEFFRIWSELRDRTIVYLESFGNSFGPFTDTDFWVVDDDLDLYLLQVEVGVLELLRPDVIHGLRDILADYPEFGMAIRVNFHGKGGETWPAMGITIYRGEIVDGLKRDYLPAEFRSLSY